MNFQPGLSADAVYDLTSYHIHNHLMNYNHPNTIGLKNLTVFKWNTWASLATWLRLTITYINPYHAKPNQT